MNLWLFFLILWCCSFFMWALATWSQNMTVMWVACGVMFICSAGMFATV